MDQSPNAEPGTIEGQVDGYVNGTVAGWAWYPDQPDRDVIITLSVDGAPFAEVVANIHRNDLDEAGKRQGRCGFAIPIAFEEFDRKSIHVVVRAKDGAVLPGGDRDVVPELPATVFPVKFDNASGLTGYIERFTDDAIVGWVTRPVGLAQPIELELWEDGAKIHSFAADIWRTDLEEARQGDGRWGFAAPVPRSLRDGKFHVVEVTAAGDRRPVLAAPLSLKFSPAQSDPAPPVRSHAAIDAKSSRVRPPRRTAPLRPLFTIIVNFYNMRREAERTLTSLSRAYQQGIGKLRYEVICIDNGSSPPLDSKWIRSFGPEFRLMRPSAPSPSPCRAINEAARQAKGRYLAIMIDGAHVLTPGVFREVWDAFTDTPDAVVALRQWFVGGDQRWLSSVGYTRDQEDILFNKIGWPEDGYRLFKIGTPIWESPNHWLDGMIESNCLFVPRAIFRRVGGMDERFTEPGAGYANLDLFKRTVSAVSEPVIALLGEASFHQFHDGTTTNVSDAQKETRVRGYENHYSRLKNERFVGVPPLDIRQRGQLRSQDAVVGRQRPLSPAKLGITEEVRPGFLPLHFDEPAAANLQSVYVESGLHKLTKWRGQRVDLAPSDVLEIQDILFEGQPGRIVAVNVCAGVLVLLDSLIHMLGLSESRVVFVGETLPAMDTVPASVDVILGSPNAPDVQAATKRALGTEERILVLLTPGAQDFQPVELLRAYARFVSCRSYLVVLGTALGQPWLGYSKYWFRTAIRAIVSELPFVIDHSRTRHFVTTCPSGYLQRILPTTLAIDEVADVAMEA